MLTVASPTMEQMHPIRRQRRRPAVVAAAGLLLMGLVLVISPFDMKAARHGQLKRVIKEDKGASHFVISETDALLSTAAARVRLEQLLEGSRGRSGASVEEAAQQELASDKSALKEIKSIGKDWGFARAGSKLTSGDSTGPAQAIMMAATNVYEKASKLAVSDPTHPRPEPALSAALMSKGDKQVVAAFHPVAHPFAADKGWSLAKEKSDMDSFYDSLDQAAAKKEAKHKAFALAHAELKEIAAGNLNGALKVAKAAKPVPTISSAPAKPAPKPSVAAAPAAPEAEVAQKSTFKVVSRAEPDGQRGSVPKVAIKAAKSAVAVAPKKGAAAEPVAKAAVSKSSSDAKPTQKTDSQPAQVRKAPFAPRALVLSGNKKEPVAPPRTTRLSDKAARSNIAGYFNNLVTEAKSQADLAHPAEPSPSLTAEAARKGLNFYYSTLEGKASPTKTAPAPTEKKVVQADKRLTDEQARVGALSFYDAEMSKASAEKRLVDKKLGVSRQSLDSVEHLKAAAAAQAESLEPAGAEGTTAPKAQQLAYAHDAAHVAARAAESAANGAKATAFVKAGHVASVPSKTDSAALSAYRTSFALLHKPRPGAHDVVKPTGGFRERPHASSAAPLPGPQAPRGVLKQVKGVKKLPTRLTKSEEHAMATEALRKHDELVASRQKAAEQHLLATSGVPAKVPVSTSGESDAAAALVAKLGESGKMLRASAQKEGVNAVAEKQVVPAELRSRAAWPQLQLEQWPSDAATL